MEPEHATDRIIAQGIIMPLHGEESGQSVRPRQPTLYLDNDSKFRWYKEGESTDAAGSSLRTAIEAARLKWPKFQVVMLRGKPVEHLRESDIPNHYAADELDQS
jgi:hypothetical protein